MSSPNRNLAEFFQKLAEEADAWPVESFPLKDSSDRWQGLFFIDRHLDESKKQVVGSTIERLSGSRANKEGQDESGIDKKQSCAVSAEERTLLFNFLQPSSQGK